MWEEKTRVDLEMPARMEKERELIDGQRKAQEFLTRVFYGAALFAIVLLVLFVKKVITEGNLP